MLKSDASWLGGVYLPKINGRERLSVRGELIYTGPYSYRHGLYTDGFTLDDKFIGYDAGPDTLSVFIKSKYQIRFDEFVAVDFRYLQRSADHYHGIYDAAGDNIGTAKDLNGPKDGNYIVRLGGQKRLSTLIDVNAVAGYDRQRNADFVGGKSAGSFSFQVRVTIHHPMPSIH
jgi:hypothetical protein